VGADADIAVWDPEATRKISVKTHHQKVDYNIFEGMTVKGMPSYTLSQGRICWANGRLDVVEGSGRYIDRPPFPISYEALAKMNQGKMPRAVVRSADSNSPRRNPLVESSCSARHKGETQEV
jgi:dihydropyrimidinase